MAWGVVCSTNMTVHCVKSPQLIGPVLLSAANLSEHVINLYLDRLTIWRTKIYLIYSCWWQIVVMFPMLNVACSEIIWFLSAVFSALDQVLLVSTCSSKEVLGTCSSCHVCYFIHKTNSSVFTEIRWSILRVYKSCSRSPAVEMAKTTTVMLW